MDALVVIDVQNEFSPSGKRAVDDHDRVLEVIRRRIEDARSAGRHIAFIRHHNLPGPSDAFQPGSWGSEFSPGIGPLPDRREEVEFVKQDFSAFTGTALGEWLADAGVAQILLVGFYTHVCVSTTAREAIMRGLDVAVDGMGTAAAQLSDEVLGGQTADEARRTALLHLRHMGVRILLPANSGRLAER